MGGNFTAAGSVAANNIAKWNGSSWSALGSGVTGATGGPAVQALACDSAGSLYAGGCFTTAGGVTANYIAKWNGSAWSALGSGMSGGTYGSNFDETALWALAFDSSGNLYAGGGFTTAGGKQSSNIAEYHMVARPMFSPAAGTYTSAQSVTISCSTKGATIYYTTDGTTPTTSSPLYSGVAIPVSSTTTIKAYAVMANGADSTVASATYTIQVATPAFSPAPGTYFGAQSVTISCATAGAAIYYTTDGSTPTTSSQQYSGAFTIFNSSTIKANAVESGMLDSAVASATYTVVNPLVISSPAYATPNPAQKNESITFTVGATDSNGDTPNFSWDFGDGTTGSGAQTSHAYPGSGQYTVTLAVTDGHGNQAQGSLTMIVLTGYQLGLHLWDCTAGREILDAGTGTVHVSNAPAPAMPHLVVHFESIAEGAPATCSLTLAYNYYVPASKRKKLKQFKLNLPKSKVQTLTSGKDWDITAALGSSIIGGEATLTFFDPTLQNPNGKLTFKICGINASETTIDSYIDTISSDSEERKMLKVLINWESHYGQFSTGASFESPTTNPTTGFPLISYDGVGAGLGQITIPYGVAVNQRDHWDWQYNCNRSLQTLRSKIQTSRKQAKKGPAQTVEQDRINSYQLFNGGFAYTLDKNTKQWVLTNSSTYGADRYTEEVARFGEPAAKPAATKPIRLK